jgi:adenylosuccinate lyase
VKPPAATTETIPNVLAERYASPAMKETWSATGRILLERDFWIAVMKAQKDLGVAIPAEAIRDYERVRGDVNVGRIKERERVTLHDVKSRIEEFSDLAQRQFIHLGQPRPDRERRAAAGRPLAAAGAVQGGRRAAGAGAARHGAP